MAARAHLYRRATALFAALAAGLCLSPCLPAQVITLIDGSTYNGVTLEGSIELAASTSATFTGGTTFTGPNAVFGTNAGLYWQQVGTFVDKDVTMASGSWIYLSGASRSLTIDGASTVTGDVSIYTDGSGGSVITNQGTLLHNSTSSGQIFAPTFTNEGSITATAGTLLLNSTSSGYSAVNTSTGTVTANGATIYIRGNFDNDGMLTAQNSGILRFDGTNTTANLGSITLATGGRALLDGILNNTSANLTAPTGGRFELYSGTISGGTIDNNALTFTNVGGYLSGATLTGDLVLPNSSYVRFTNGASFTGSNATLGTSARVYWEQTGTLSGKAISIGAGGYLYLSGANRSLTIDSTSTVTGDVSIYTDGSGGSVITNQGTLLHNSTSTGQIFAPTFTNEGSITATTGTLYLSSSGYSAVNTSTGTVTANGATIYIRGNFDNDGMLTAQNSGILRFDGTNTTANLGSITLATGGRALLDGILNNTSANLTAPTGGRFELYSGTISGGTIDNNALTFTGAGGYLSGATLTGDLVLPNSSHVRFNNGTSFTGTNATFGTSAGVYWEQTGTLSGKSISIGAGGYLYLSGANRSLTIDSTSTVTGDVSIYTDGSGGSVITNQGTLLHNSTSTGQIFAPTFTNEGSITATTGTLYLSSSGYSAVNTSTGTVTADGATIYIRGNFDNDGMLTAQNSGILRFDGTNTTANLGSITLATGGRALLDGILNNTSANLTAPVGGRFELYSGTISGGTIDNNALTFTGAGGYLSGATLTGDLVLPNSSYVRFNNGASFTGANATLGTSAGIYWEQTGTLSGKAISIGGGGYVYLNGASRSLTIDATSTVTGDVSIYSDGSAGNTIVNRGTLLHNSTSSGQIYASTFTNEGSITATAGTLHLNYPSSGYSALNTSTGTVIADGATIYIRGNFDNDGMLTAQNSGILRFDGTNTTANLGSITLATGGRALLDGTLNNTSANLTAPAGGRFELYTGTISGGTIDNNALTFTSAGGYLSGATLTGDLVLPNSSYVRFNNGTSFTGSSATLGTSAGIYWEQTGSLSGKAVSIGAGGYVYLNGASQSLTIDATSTVTGDVSIYSDGSAGNTIVNRGTLLHNSATSGQIYAPNFTNEGSITATAGTLYLNYPSSVYNAFNTSIGTVTADGATIYIRGNFDNDGTLTAQNSGILRFDGTNTTANLGSITLATGGRALLDGTLNNTSANLTAPAGGRFELYTGTISGGTIDNNALTFTSAGGYLSGATLTGDLVLPNGSYVRFSNGASFTGANATLGTNARIYWEQMGTLSGKTVNIGAGGFLYLNGASRSLTIDATSTVTGNVSIYSDGSAGNTIVNRGNLLHNSTNSAQIYAPNFTNEGSITATAGSLLLNYPSSGYSAVNAPTGTVTADGATIYIRGNFDNDGTLTAQNSGILRLDGTNTTANLGSITLATGGRALLDGILNNTLANLTAPAGGRFELYTGTISGGTIDSNALTFTNVGGYLSGATLTGDLVLPNSSYVRFSNGTSFTGTNATLGTNAGVYWQQTGTLSGKSLGLAGGAFWYVSGTNSTLTLDSSTTVSGDLSIYSDGSTGTAVTNQGTLLHNTGSGTLYARNWTNAGSITATAGTLSIGSTTTGYTFANSPGATLSVNGATVYLHAPSTAPVVNEGVISVQSGTLYISNTLLNEDTGSIRGAGIISGDLTLAGGTLAPGNSIGTLTFSSSDFAVTGPAVLQIELGGTSADRVTFQNPTSIVSLGSGLLDLSLSLLSAPALNTTFTILDISSGGSGISGYFNGLASTGAALSANFGGTDYTFHVTYLANSITITSVPEPGTYGLFALGLAVVGLIARRRSRGR